MQVYLPIAGMTANLFLLLGMGGVVGMLSGLFGVGGGFLITPLLIFIGVPPPIAVATAANQVIASSVSGALAHWRRGNVDVKMGVMLLLGGIVGSSAGVLVFRLLRGLGQIDLVIALAYVFFLGTIGTLMLIESVQAMRRAARPAGPRRKLHQHTFLHGLPFKMRFRRSKLYISALLPLGVGFGVGVLAAIMGVGGGFVLVPAMIYLLGMPTAIVIGTSLFQIIFVGANVTFMQAWQNQTVDVVLALVLVVGGVLGAQVGTRLGERIAGSQLRGLLALLVLLVSAKLGIDLFTAPADLYNLAPYLH